MPGLAVSWRLSLGPNEASSAIRKVRSAPPGVIGLALLLTPSDEVSSLDLGESIPEPDYFGKIVRRTVEVWARSQSRYHGEWG